MSEGAGHGFDGPELDGMVADCFAEHLKSPDTRWGGTD